MRFHRLPMDHRERPILLSLILQKCSKQSKILFAFFQFSVFKYVCCSESELNHVQLTILGSPLGGECFEPYCMVELSLVFE